MQATANVVLFAGETDMVYLAKPNGAAAEWRAMQRESQVRASETTTFGMLHAVSVRRCCAIFPRALASCFSNKPCGGTCTWQIPLHVHRNLGHQPFCIRSKRALRLVKFDMMP